MSPRHFRRLTFSGCWLACAAGAALAANSFGISAPAFATGKPMPARFVLSGDNLSPALHISNVPARTRSLALIVDDPDAPAGLWTHWLVWNLPPDTIDFSEGRLPSEQAREGKNSFGHVRYDGPAPPPHTGVHRYFFRVYALDSTLSLPAGADRATLLEAMKGHTLGTAETFGTFQATP